MHVDFLYAFAGGCVGVIYWQGTQDQDRRDGVFPWIIRRAALTVLFAVSWPTALLVTALYYIPVTRRLMQGWVNWEKPRREESENRE